MYLVPSSNQRQSTAHLVRESRSLSLSFSVRSLSRASPHTTLVCYLPFVPLFPRNGSRRVTTDLLAIRAVRELPTRTFIVTPRHSSLLFTQRTTRSPLILSLCSSFTRRLHPHVGGPGSGHIYRLGYDSGLQEAFGKYVFLTCAPRIGDAVTIVSTPNLFKGQATRRCTLGLARQSGR